jgi:hypothetical protein
MESNKDAGKPKELSLEEMTRLRDETQACAVEIAKTMFKHSSSPKVSVLAAMMVAAGGARATGVDKHMALDMFLTFYNDATNFMMEE